MKIIGISAFYHDSAACLINDGEIIAAAQEERFTRIKHDKSFPINAIKFCLNFHNVSLKDIDYICFYEKPVLKFERIISTHLRYAPRSFDVFKEAMRSWIPNKLSFKKLLLHNLKEINNGDNLNKKIIFSEHHLSHAASAFYPSPFKESAILTMDGVGEYTTTSIAYGNSNKIEILKEIFFPHSLGMLYSAITSYAGFRVNSGEYKLMGLAPYGKPIYSDLIKEHLIYIKQDGSFKLNMDYFNFHIGRTMTNEKFHSLFNGNPRKPESEISQKEMDLAASIQAVCEEIIINLAKNIRNETKSDNLCLAGGVALNCVANGKLHNEKIFKNIWIQPAAGDAGGALGAALSAYYQHLGYERYLTQNQDSMKGSYLGTEYNDKDIKKRLNKICANYSAKSMDECIQIAANAISKGKAIGWFQGRMEFGPRALGARSIIGDARSESMQKILNLKVKYRESFRPFAPSVLLEEASKWFYLDSESPYMLIVQNLRDEHCYKNNVNTELFGLDRLNQVRSSVPAVTHVDYSARIQTVDGKYNIEYYNLLKEFKKLTGCPIIVNTSFNVRGEPIVNSPEDAFNCFMGTDIDILIIGKNILFKKDQDKKLLKDYSSQFKLD